MAKMGSLNKGGPNIVVLYALSAKTDHTARGPEARWCASTCSTAGARLARVMRQATGSRAVTAVTANMRTPPTDSMSLGCPFLRSRCALRDVRDRRGAGGLARSPR